MIVLLLCYCYYYYVYYYLLLLLLLVLCILPLLLLLLLLSLGPRRQQPGFSAGDFLRLGQGSINTYGIGYRLQLYDDSMAAVSPRSVEYRPLEVFRSESWPEHAKTLVGESIFAAVWDTHGYRIVRVCAIRFCSDSSSHHDRKTLCTLPRRDGTHLDAIQESPAPVDTNRNPSSFAYRTPVPANHNTPLRDLTRPYNTPAAACTSPVFVCPATAAPTHHTAWEPLQGGG